MVLTALAVFVSGVSYSDDDRMRGEARFLALLAVPFLAASVVLLK